MRIDDSFNFLLPGSNARQPTFKEYRKLFPVLMRQLKNESAINNRFNEFIFIEKYAFANHTFGPLFISGIITQPWVNLINTLQGQTEWNKSNYPFRGHCNLIGDDLQLSFLFPAQSTAGQKAEKEKYYFQLIEDYLFQEGIVKKITLPNGHNSAPNNMVLHSVGIYDKKGGNPEVTKVKKSTQLLELPTTNSFLPSNLNVKNQNIRLNTQLTTDPDFIIKSFPIFGKKYNWARQKNRQIGIVPSADLNNMRNDFPRISINLNNALSTNFGTNNAPIYILNPIKTIKNILSHCSILDHALNSIWSSEIINTYINQIIPNVLPNVITRLNADMALLRQNRLIGAQETLVAIELSGSDFHKQFQQVVFFHFSQGSKVVYKPGNLELDQLLFGAPAQGHQQSFANFVDPTGLLIPTYKIITRSDQNGDYGYLEFIHEELPTNTNEVHQMCNSIAANMALSFMIGLEDIHYENIIVRKNKIQLIDMEAASGVSDLSNNRDWVSTKLWGLGLTNRQPKTVKSKLEAFINSNRAQFPRNINVNLVKGTATTTFNKIIQAFNNLNAAPATLLNRINNITTRIVPITTEWFTQRTFVFKSNTNHSFQADAANPQSMLVQDANSFSPAQNNAISKFLSSPATFTALNRLDIPFYYNNLGLAIGANNKITDEAGNNINIIPADNFPKITNSIRAEIITRINMNQNTITTSFTNHGLPLIQDIFSLI